MSHATCHAAPPPACTPAGERRSAPYGLPAHHHIAWLAAAFDRLARPWRRRESIRELHRLSDRELRDIGIARGEIEGVVNELMTR